MKRTPLLSRSTGVYTITVRDVIITAAIRAEPTQNIAKGYSGGILIELDGAFVAVRSNGVGGVMEYVPREHRNDASYVASLVIEHFDDLLGGSADNERITIRRWVRTLMGRLEGSGD